MSLISRLREAIQQFVEPIDEGSAEHDEHLTAAALLVLVARIDGRLLAVEEQALRAMLKARFDLDDEAAARILAAAADLDEPATGASAIAARILQETPVEDRPDLLAMAFRVAAVDGFVHEFEDDLVWRIGRLLGFDESTIARIREAAFRNLTPERARRA